MNIYLPISIKTVLSEKELKKVVEAIESCHLLEYNSFRYTPPGGSPISIYLKVEFLEEGDYRLLGQFTELFTQLVTARKQANEAYTKNQEYNKLLESLDVVKKALKDV